MKLFFSLFFLLLSTAQAHWPSGAVRAGTGDYVAAPAFAAIALTSRLAGETSQSTWQRTNPFDLSVRDALRADSFEGRQRAKSISDVLFYGMIGTPVVMDTVIALALHRDRDLAWQILWMDLTTISVATAVSVPVLSAIERDRPLVAECEVDPDYSPLCGSPNAYRSFYSGHTSMAVASAGLICTTHLSLDLLGGPWDELTCGVAAAAGLSTGILRIQSDAHWASDVLVGVGIGTLVGVGMPMLRMRGVRAQPHVTPRTVGLPAPF